MMASIVIQLQGNFIQLSILILLMMKVQVIFQNVPFEKIIGLGRNWEEEEEYNHGVLGLRFSR